MKGKGSYQLFVANAESELKAEEPVPKGKRVDGSKKQGSGLKMDGKNKRVRYGHAFRI